MCTQKFFRSSVKIAVVLLLLLGCSVPEAVPVPPTEPPPSPTPVPPTQLLPSPTPVPPTELPASPTPLPTTESPPTPTAPILLTSADMLVGNWQPLSTGRDAMYLQINSDGTCRQSYSLDGLNDVPEVECEYAFEGTDVLFTVVKLNNVPECPSATARYQIRLLADDQIGLVATGDSCAPRVRSTRGEYQRIP